MKSTEKFPDSRSLGHGKAGWEQNLGFSMEKMGLSHPGAGWNSLRQQEEELEAILWN